MYEFGLAAGILQMLEAAAVRDRFQRFAQLHLGAGALPGSP